MQLEDLAALNQLHGRVVARLAWHEQQLDVRKSAVARDGGTWHRQALASRQASEELRWVLAQLADIATQL